MATSAPTIKRLFALSGNRCAFPGCNNPLIDRNGVLIADVCHIAGARPGAARYDASQTEEQRQAFDNLIVLCPNHHRIIDSDEVTYTRAVLRKMKQAHEASAAEEFVISDHQAQQIAAILGGATIATALGEIMRNVADLIRTVHDALPDATLEHPETQPPRVLLETLRYAPTGAFQAVGSDDPHRRLGGFFTEVFKAAGWRQTEGVDVYSHHLGPTPRLTLLFILRDRHQIPIAEQAIREVFERCGFAREGNDELRKVNGGIVLRIYSMVIAQH